MKKGKKAKLTAFASKENRKKKLLKNSHVKTIRWYSSDSKIVKVKSSGIIKAKKKGFCKIYATSANGIKKVITIIVKLYMSF